MTNRQIGFKQERDFGDLFNATFNFIGQEFKRLGAVILYYTVPFLILSAIAGTLYSVKIQGLSQEMAASVGSSTFTIFSMWGSMMGYILLYITLSATANIMLLTTAFCYIKLYIRCGADEFTVNDVWREIMKHFWSVFLASILFGILVTIGLGLCFLPGIYLIVALSLLFPSMIFEEIGLSDAMNRSFTLIKSNWWFSFGVFIVAGIIFYILSILISVPSIAMGFKTIFFNIKQEQDPSLEFSTGFYVLNSITNLVTQVLEIIPIVLVAFLYYSFVEKKEKTSLFEKIEQITEEE